MYAISNDGYYKYKCFNEKGDVVIRLGYPQRMMNATSSAHPENPTYSRPTDEQMDVCKPHNRHSKSKNETRKKVTSKYRRECPVISTARVSTV